MVVCACDAVSIGSRARETFMRELVVLEEKSWNICQVLDRLEVRGLWLNKYPRQLSRVGETSKVRLGACCCKVLMCERWGKRVSGVGLRDDEPTLH